MKHFLLALVVGLAILGLGACRGAPARPVASPTSAASPAVLAAATLAPAATEVAPAPTLAPPTDTASPVPAPTDTATATGTPVPPSPTLTATPTRTVAPPTVRPTPLPATATHTPVPPAAPQAGRVNAGLLGPAATGNIDALFADRNHAGAPGCSVGIGQEGSLIYGRGYGAADLQHGVPITTGTVFNAGSVAKQVTALAVELLAEDGRLSLDDDLRRYVPELPAYAANITLREMLAHTSGLRDDRTLALMAGRDDGLLSAQYLLDLIYRQQATNFEPGQRFSYSNSNFTLLALIVSRVSGQPFEQFTGERIFAPLGMKHTSFAADPWAVVPGRALGYSGYGGYSLSMPNAALPGPTDLFTTVGDLVTWADNYSTARAGSRDGLAAAMQPAHNSQGGKVAYNFGLQQRNYRDLGPALFHDGIDGGFRAALIFWPDQRKSVAVLCNVDVVDPEELALQAARVSEGLPPPTPTRQPTPRPAVPAESYVELPPAALEHWAGLYYDPDRARLLRLYVEGKRLRFDGLPELELAPLAPDHFRFFSSGRAIPGEAFFSQEGPALEIKKTNSFNGTYRRYPDLAAGPNYAGAYYSPELDATYSISVKRGILMLDSKAFVDAYLMPSADAGPGHFEMAGALPPITVEFTFGDGEKVTGFAFSLDRARNVRFDRAP
jgi:CubicO group peptidase (beta-lactamase class C family)